MQRDAQAAWDDDAAMEALLQVRLYDLGRIGTEHLAASSPAAGLDWTLHHCDTSLTPVSVLYAINSRQR